MRGSCSLVPSVWMIIRARAVWVGCLGSPPAGRVNAIGIPSADISTVPARHTNECGKLREQTIESNCSRSAELNSTTTLLGLAKGSDIVPEHRSLVKSFVGQYTSLLSQKRDE